MRSEVTPLLLIQCLEQNAFVQLLQAPLASMAPQAFRGWSIIRHLQDGPNRTSPYQSIFRRAPAAGSARTADHQAHA
jgi:hypothetical protein